MTETTPPKARPRRVDPDGHPIYDSLDGYAGTPVDEPDLGSEEGGRVGGNPADAAARVDEKGPDCTTDPGYRRALVALKAAQREFAPRAALLRDRRAEITDRDRAAISHIAALRAIWVERCLAAEANCPADHDHITSAEART